MFFFRKIWRALFSCNTRFLLTLVSVALWSYCRRSLKFFEDIIVRKIYQNTDFFLPIFLGKYGSQKPFIMAYYTQWPAKRFQTTNQIWCNNTLCDINTLFNRIDENMYLTKNHLAMQYRFENYQSQILSVGLSGSHSVEYFIKLRRY